MWPLSRHLWEVIGKAIAGQEIDLDDLDEWDEWADGDEVSEEELRNGACAWPTVQLVTDILLESTKTSSR